MFSLRSSLYPHYGHTVDALWILMMLYPNIVEARRGRRSIKTITIPARTIVWSLVFVVLLFIYFSVTNISESESVKYVRLLKFFSSHFASYPRAEVLAAVCETISCSQICKINVFSPHGQSVGLAAATASPGLHQPSQTSWDKEAMESSSSSSSRAAQHHLQRLLSFFTTSVLTTTGLQKAV